MCERGGVCVDFPEYRVRTYCSSLGDQAAFRVRVRALVGRVRAKGQGDVLGKASA